MLNFFRSALLVMSSLLFVSAPALAADQSLAEYKYVLHISDMDPSKQELILNNARNLLDAYPPGDVEVEIVAYGPGLRLMFAENVNAQRIDSLSQSGVKFTACGNTLKGMAKLLGRRAEAESGCHRGARRHRAHRRTGQAGIHLRQTLTSRNRNYPSFCRGTSPAGLTWKPNYKEQ